MTILHDDWDMTEDLTTFVEPLIPEIFTRFGESDDSLKSCVI